MKKFAALMCVLLAAGCLDARQIPGESSESQTPLAWEQIEVHTWSACAMRTDGKVSCWGHEGPEGAASFGVSAVPDRAYVKIGYMRHIPCGIDEAGSVVCWGQQGVHVFESEHSEGLSYVDFHLSTLGWCGEYADGSLQCHPDIKGPGAMMESFPPPAERRQVREYLGSGDRLHYCMLYEDGRLECFRRTLYKDYEPWRMPSDEFVTMGRHLGCGISRNNQLYCATDRFGMRMVERRYDDVYAYDRTLLGYMTLGSSGVLTCHGDDQRLCAALNEEYSAFSADYYSACAISLSGELQCATVCEREIRPNVFCDDDGYFWVHDSPEL